jgi:hypothetical protein
MNFYSTFYIIKKSRLNFIFKNIIFKFFFYSSKIKRKREKKNLLVR